jgi:hypothetical protein
MRYLVAAVTLTGCWQMTIYVGPRVDSTGAVSVELGASLGMAVATPRGGGALSLDTSMPIPQPALRCPAGGCAIARSSTGGGDDAAASRAEIRGVLEWIGRPPASDREFLRAPGLGWRAGISGGLDVRADGRSFGSIGGLATISPWIWGFDGATSKQFIAFGMQLGAEMTPEDGRFVGRAALACDLHFFPR